MSKKQLPIELNEVSLEFYSERLPMSNLSYFEFANKPDAFNGMVNVFKFKIEVKRVDEDRDIIVKRCIDLYRKCSDNIHNRESILRFVDRELKIDRSKFYLLLEESQ